MISKNVFNRLNISLQANFPVNPPSKTGYLPLRPLGKISTFPVMSSVISKE
jgi:hypothetical protein